MQHSMPNWAVQTNSPPSFATVNKDVARLDENSAVYIYIYRIILCERMHMPVLQQQIVRTVDSIKDIIMSSMLFPLSCSANSHAHTA
jgi:hypothetical protein